MHVKSEDIGLEFVFARHSEYKYDYKNGKIFYAVNKAEFFILDEMIDKADPKFEMLDVYRNIDSFSKAKAAKMEGKKRSGKWGLVWKWLSLISILMKNKNSTLIITDG